MATQRSYPFVGSGPTSDAEWSILTRESIGTGVRTGLEVYANSTGLKVFVRPGDAKIRGHEYINEADGDIELPITAPGSAARTDAVVLRLEYGTEKSIRVVVKPGTPGAPALTQTDVAVYEMLLAYVTVSASAVTITAANVIDRRAFLSAGIPAGVGMPFFGSVVPGGWLLCDGRVLNRVDYPALYGAIGTIHNVGGETSTEFRLPNMRGRSPVGYDPSQTEFNARGKTGGEKTHTLTAAEMPVHAHGQNVSAGTAAGPAIRRDYSSDGTGVAYAQGISTANAGGGAAHNNLPPYMAVDYIVKT